MSEPREQAAAAAAAAAASPQGGCRCAGGVGRAPTVLSLLFSLLAVSACFLLSARTSKLQGRLVALEGELASRAWSPGEQPHAEPWLALLQPQVDKVLQEKLGEGLAKLRTAREAPSECRCPPDLSTKQKRRSTLEFESVLSGIHPELNPCFLGSG